MWNSGLNRVNSDREKDWCESYWELLPVLTERQLLVHPSSSELTFSWVSASNDFFPNSPACSPATRPLGWAETKQTHLTLCVVIQASFKAKDLCLGVPTNITGIRLMEPDQGSPYLLRAFPSTALSIIPSLTSQQSNQSIKCSYLSQFLFSLYLFPTSLLSYLLYVYVFSELRNVRVNWLMEKPQSSGQAEEIQYIPLFTEY